MYRVEKHIIRNNKEMDELCHLSKNLYNYCNYILRQLYFKNFENIKEFQHIIKSFKVKNEEYFQINEYDLDKCLLEMNQVDFRALPIDLSYKIVKLVYDDWKSFFKLVKIQKDLKEKPKIPKYKDKGGKHVVVFVNKKSCSMKKDNCIHFCKKSKIKPIKTNVKKEQLVLTRIVPQANCYIVEVVYKIGQKTVGLDDKRFLSIDLGINNLATCVNNVGFSPFIINGKVIKSINQYYNKKLAKLKSLSNNKSTKRIQRLHLKRKCKIEDYLHKSSRYIVDYCIDNKIKTIIIGYNVGWKDEIDLGKTNNQKFTFIPYKKFIDMIIYKSEEYDIRVVINEESYTSKCDSLAKEEICYHETYKGKRVKRGLFRSSTDKIINADVNGAINIMRKVIGDSCVNKIINRGKAFNPYKVKII